MVDKFDRVRTFPNLTTTWTISVSTYSVKFVHESGIPLRSSHLYVSMAVFLSLWYTGAGLAIGFGCLVRQALWGILVPVLLVSIVHADITRKNWSVLALFVKQTKHPPHFFFLLQPLFVDAFAICFEKCDFYLYSLTDVGQRSLRHTSFIRKTPD